MCEIMHGIRGVIPYNDPSEARGIIRYNTEVTMHYLLYTIVEI